MVLERLRHVLTTTGLLAVRLSSRDDQESYQRHRTEALQHGLCRCHDQLLSSSSRSGNNNNNNNVERVVLHQDQQSTTMRTTVATSTAGAHAPLPLVPSNHNDGDGDPSVSQSTPLLLQACGADTVQAMEDLRDDVSVVTNAFVKAVDQLFLHVWQSSSSSSSPSSSPPPLLRNAYQGTYSTLASIQAAAMHLEHFHVYSKTSSSTTKNIHNNHNHTTSNKTRNKRQSGTRQGQRTFQEEEHTKDHDIDATTQTTNTNTRMLEWHIDAGLFLTFVPAVNCASRDNTDNNDNDNDDASFYWWNPETHQAVALPSSSFSGGNYYNNVVLIMLGAGAQHWLHTSHHDTALSFRATRHAVQMNQPNQQQGRAWYGMMTMVPDIAIVQENPDRTLADMKQQMALIMSSQSSSNTQSTVSSNHTAAIISIGCGSHPYDSDMYEDDTLDKDNDDNSQTGLDPLYPSSSSRHRRRRMMQVHSAAACNNVTNFFCWMSCLDIPNARLAPKYLDKGYSLYCMDPQIYAQSGNQVAKAVDPCAQGWANNPECLGKWAKTATTASSDAPPPYQLQLRPDDNNDNNNNDHDEDDHYHDSLDHHDNKDNENTFCYGGTSMYMGGFAWMRPTCVIFLFSGWVLTSRGKFVLACLATWALGCALEWILHQRRHTIQVWAPFPGWTRLGILSTLYAVQLIMGYLLMLVIMTYNGLLFLSSILGLVAGHILFNSQDVAYLFGKKRRHRPAATEPNVVTKHSTPLHHHHDSHVRDPHRHLLHHSSPPGTTTATTAPAPSPPESWNNHHPPPPRHFQHPEWREFIKRSKHHHGASSDRYYAVAVDYPDDDAIGGSGREDDIISGVSSLSRTGSMGTMNNESSSRPMTMTAVPDGATPCCQNDLVGG
ncbi:hypothetical protein ACA910_003631 [Epithemia clementina (nom. ined.)]